MKIRSIKVDDEAWQVWSDVAEAQGKSIAEWLRDVAGEAVGRKVCEDCGGRGWVQLGWLQAGKVEAAKTISVKQKVEQPVDPVRNAVVESKPASQLTQKPLPPTGEKQPMKPEDPLFGIENSTQIACISCGDREGHQDGPPMKYHGRTGWLCKVCRGMKVDEPNKRSGKDHAA